MWGKLIKKDFLIKNNISFPNNISFAEDLASVAIWFMYKPSIQYSDEYLYNYYQRIDGITNSLSIKVLEVEKAILFIKNQLILNNLYLLYKEEFEKMIFTHIMMLRVLKINHPIYLQKKLYCIFKNMHVNIYKNTYICEEVYKNNIIFRLRLRAYDTGYYLGKLYDIGRELSLKFIKR